MQKLTKMAQIHKDREDNRFTLIVLAWAVGFGLLGSLAGGLLPALCAAIFGGAVGAFFAVIDNVQNKDRK